MEIQLHNIVMHTKALGPGVRTAIWFQGCHRECNGCMSPASRSLDGGRMIEVRDVINAIVEISGDIEGVTISGGEPFLQIEALHFLLKSIREQTDLGVIIYTGYKMSELSEMNNSQVDEVITSLSDVIIDGEYVEELNDGIALRGSSNQKVNFITDRYVAYEFLYQNKSRNAEVLATENELFMVGIPSKDTLNQWIEITEQMKSRQ